ncbi:MAG: M48 family metalloprotease [Bdellovibrionales bacterium]|nr:M48 family metalloprotease [Bdellovibrionales bacterium]
MKNSTRTWYFLTFISIALILGGHALNGRPGLLWGVGLAALLNTLVYFYSDLKLDKIFRGRIVDGQDPWGLIEMTRQMSSKARIEIPLVVILNVPGYQAFATGKSTSHNKIFVTEDLLKNFDKEELQAVIAYLVANIKNQDTISFGVASLLSGVILSTSLFLDKKFSWIFSSNLYKKVSQSQGGILTWLLAPLASVIVRISISRENYFKTDALAVSWLDNPKAYARALWKLESYTQTMPIRVPLDTAHMFIVNPLTKNAKTRYFRIQPNTEKRIKRLIGYFPI